MTMVSTKDASNLPPLGSFALSSLRQKRMLPLSAVGVGVILSPLRDAMLQRRDLPGHPSKRSSNRGCDDRVVISDAMSKRARSFEVGAATYERVRPEFPEALFDDLVATAGRRVERGVLEIGAGTGRATLPLARRGLQVQVVEPSADMVRVLAGRLAAEGLQDSVVTRRATFEEVSFDEGPFGVVVAAQSFHWADPHSRWNRLASLLAGDGLAFLFWNGWQLDPSRHDLEAVRAAYDRAGAGVVPDIDDHRGAASWAEQEVADEPLLEMAATTTYGWGRTLPVTDYLDLLATTSQYAVADAVVRRQLFDSLGPVLGATVELTGRTVLLTVRRHVTDR